MMDTGKKKKEITKITDESCRMVTFSKKKKTLFNKAEEFESMSGSRVASIVFSPSGMLYTCGDIDSAINKHFPSSSCTKQPSISGGSSGLKRKGLRGWVEGIDVEGCQNLNQLLLLKKQLEGTRKQIIVSDAKSFEAFFA